MKSNAITEVKAFTLLEIIIVSTIILLIAAMSIPAFMKIREGSIVKAYQQGAKLDASDMKVVREYYARMKTKTTVLGSEPTETPILIPYDQVTEVTINGEKFYAWTKK